MPRFLRPSWTYKIKPKAKIPWYKRNFTSKDVKQLKKVFGASPATFLPGTKSAKAKKSKDEPVKQEQIIKATYAKAGKKQRSLKNFVKHTNRRFKYLPKTY